MARLRNEADADDDIFPVSPGCLYFAESNSIIVFLAKQKTDVPHDVERSRTLERLYSKLYTVGDRSFFLSSRFSSRLSVRPCLLYEFFVPIRCFPACSTAVTIVFKFRKRYSPADCDSERAREKKKLLLFLHTFRFLSHTRSTLSRDSSFLQFLPLRRLDRDENFHPSLYFQSSSLVYEMRHATFSACYTYKVF